MNVELQTLKRLINLRELLFAEIRKVFIDQNLTSTEIMILYTLQHRQGEIKAGDLAAELFLPQSTMTGIIDKMIRKGIVQRNRSEEDRRVVMITLNPDFKRISDGCMIELQKMVGGLAEETPPGWFSQLNEYLIVLENILENRVNFNGGTDGNKK